MKKQRNHSFPKTYTTAGAAYRARKVFEGRFPDMAFMIVKQDGKFVLEGVTQTQEVEVSDGILKIVQ